MAFNKFFKKNIDEYGLNNITDFVLLHGETDRLSDKKKYFKKYYDI